MQAPSIVAITATAEQVRGSWRVRVNRAYVDAVAAAGLIPVVIPPADDPTVAVRVLDVADGLLLTGGEDVDPAAFGAEPHPATHVAPAARDATELALTRAARERRIPTLAICRGAQVVNVALGGTLVQDIPSERPGSAAHDPGGSRDLRVHDIAIERGTRLGSIVGASTISTNSFHHQSIDRLAPPLRCSATAPDGIIEGVEPSDADWWMVAVQWHPEELTSTPEPWDRALFEAFAEAVRSRGKSGSDPGV